MLVSLKSAWGNLNLDDWPLNILILKKASQCPTTSLLVKNCFMNYSETSALSYFPFLMYYFGDYKSDSTCGGLSLGQLSLPPPHPAPLSYLLREQPLRPGKGIRKDGFLRCLRGREKTTLLQKINCLVCNILTFTRCRWHQVLEK